MGALVKHIRAFDVKFSVVTRRDEVEFSFTDVTSNVELCNMVLEKRDVVSAAYAYWAHQWFDN